jgi:hypothetical protein
MGAHLQALPSLKQKTMLFIDGKEIDWEKVSGNAANAIRKYTKPHTWTIATHRIKYDYANSRIQCPSVGVLTKYSSRFCYNGKPKATHTVEYSTGSQPHPSKQGVQLNTPAMLMIEGGVEKDVVDNEINFFHAHAPWTEDGIAYEKKYERQINLYSEEKVYAKSESNAEIKVRLLTRILTLKQKDVVAMARSIEKMPGRKSGLFVDDGILEGDNQQLINSHITSLKDAIFRYADNNPHQLRNLLANKTSEIFTLYEEAMSMDLLRLDTENMVAPVQAVWRMKKSETEETEICTVSDEERPVDAFVTFMGKAKSETILGQLRDLIEIEKKRKEVNLTT